MRSHSAAELSTALGWLEDASRQLEDAQAAISALEADKGALQAVLAAQAAAGPDADVAVELAGQLREHANRSEGLAAELGALRAAIGAAHTPGRKGASPVAAELEEVARLHRTSAGRARLKAALEQGGPAASPRPGRPPATGPSR